jgi:sugar phosphate isomerase/epimerase
MGLRIGTGFGPIGKLLDRYVPEGYSDGVPLDRQLELAKQVPGLDGVALDYPMQFQDPVRMKHQLDQVGLQLCILWIDTVGDRKWKMGSFAAPEPRTRREAVDLVKRGVDVAAAMGCQDILLWLAQDGYDYPFQVDYGANWGYLVEGMREVAAYAPTMRFGIEYKAKEPRVRCHIATCAQTLLLAQAVGLPNVGVTIDQGHSLLSQEHPAEAVAMAGRFGRLFQVHVDDNWGDWDSDLIVGGVNFWSALEFFYALQKADYDGWYLMDLYPYRENGFNALAACIRNTRRFASLAARLRGTELGVLQATHDTLAINELLWNYIIQLD